MVSKKMLELKDREIKRLKWELLMVSKLAAETPQFYNPFHVAQAKKVRDNVLAHADDYE